MNGVKRDDLEYQMGLDKEVWIACLKIEELLHRQNVEYTGTFLL